MSRVRTRTARTAATAALVCAALALVSCNLQQGIAAQQPAPASSPSAAPPVNGTTTTGAHFAWQSAQGRVVVLDFWGSWCGPCRAEQQDINRLYTKYTARGVLFLGVDMRDDDASANAFRHDYAVAYSSIDDADETVAANYDVAAPPTIVVIDRSGHVVQRFLGTIVGVGDVLDRLLGA